MELKVTVKTLGRKLTINPDTIPSTHNGELPEKCRGYTGTDVVSNRQFSDRI